jgi:hypothetical protein
VTPTIAITATDVTLLPRTEHRTDDNCRTVTPMLPCPATGNRLHYLRTRHRADDSCRLTTNMKRPQRYRTVSLRSSVFVSARANFQGDRCVNAPRGFR